MYRFKLAPLMSVVFVFLTSPAVAVFCERNYCQELCGQDIECNRKERQKALDHYLLYNDTYDLQRMLILAGVLNLAPSAEDSLYWNAVRVESDTMLKKWWSDDHCRALEYFPQVPTEMTPDAVFEAQHLLTPFVAITSRGIQFKELNQKELRIFEALRGRINEKPSLLNVVQGFIRKEILDRVIQDSRISEPQFDLVWYSASAVPWKLITQHDDMLWDDYTPKERRKLTNAIVSVGDYTECDIDYGVYLEDPRLVEACQAVVANAGREIKKLTEVWEVKQIWLSTSKLRDLTHSSCQSVAVLTIWGSLNEEGFSWSYPAFKRNLDLLARYGYIEDPQECVNSAQWMF